MTDRPGPLIVQAAPIQDHAAGSCERDGSLRSAWQGESQPEEGRECGYLRGDKGAWT